MNLDIEELMLTVIDGNPGAMTIIKRLMCLPTWPSLLYYLADQGLIGSRLWTVVKEEYDNNCTWFAQNQLLQMGLTSIGSSTPAYLSRLN